MVINKEKNFASIVVYSYNNEDYIEKFLHKINKFFKDNFEHFEIIFVDDKSSDKSVEVIKKASSKINGTIVSIINMSSYHGIEMSMNAGVDLAIGDFVFEFDTMFIDYDMNIIMDVYRKCLEGNDIVSASSNSKMRLSSKVFYKIFNKFSNNNNKLCSETFRIISRRAINRAKEVNKTIPYRKAVYLNCGLKHAKIKYDSKNIKKHNISKEVNNTRKEVAIDSIILFTDVAYKFAISMVGLMMLFLIGTIVYTIVIYFSQSPIEGWTTTMILLSFAFFGLFSILTIMIKYLSILVDLIFKKKSYLIESIEKITK